MKQPEVYYLQNRAIHYARAQLEKQGILHPESSLEACRLMAGKINLGIESISRLSLKQREVLIGKLNQIGATVRNPHIYASDLEAERRLSGSKEPRKIILFREPKEDQLRMLDALASQVHWREQDGYLRLCYKLFRSPRPRNSKEVTRLRLVLQNLLSTSQTPVYPQSTPGPALVH